MSTRKWRIVNFVLNIAKKWSAKAEVTWPADGNGSRPTSPLMHERLELWWNYIHLMKMEHEQPFYRCKELYFIILILEENHGLQSGLFLWTFYRVSKKMLLLSSFEFLTLGGVFLGVKNDSKNFGNKKILGCLAKFWVNGHYLSEKCRKFCDFISLWPCLEWNIF